MVGPPSPRGSALLALAFLLSGCTGAAPPSTGDLPVPLPALTMPWELRDCDFAVAILAVPAADVQHLVPAGFRVQSVAEVAIGGQTGQPVPNPADDGNLGIEVFDCGSGTGLPNETLDRVAYASVFIGVEPPAGLAQDVNNHFVKLDTLVPDAARRDVLQQHGVPAVNGSTSFSLSTDIAGYLYAATLDLNGTRYAFQGNGLVPLPAGSFVEFQQTPHGLAIWSMQYALESGGAGTQTVEFPAGSLPASILGAGTQRGGGFAGRGSFTGGAIVLPAGNVTA